MQEQGMFLEIDSRLEVIVLSLSLIIDTNLAIP